MVLSSAAPADGEFGGNGTAKKVVLVSMIAAPVLNNEHELVSAGS